MNIQSRILLGLMIALTVWLPMHAQEDVVPVIDVVGRSSVVLEPDHTEWVIEIVTDDKLVEQAMEVNDALYEKLVSIIDDAGVEEDQIVAGSLRVKQLFRDRGGRSRDWGDYQGTEIRRRVRFKLFETEADELAGTIEAVQGLGVHFALRYKSSQYDETLARVTRESLLHAKELAADQADVLGQEIGPAVFVNVMQHDPGGYRGGLFGYDDPIEEDAQAAGDDGKIHVRAFAHVKFRLDP